MKERMDVYQLPKGDTTLKWYAAAVAEMKKRPTTNPTSWNFQAGIHGFQADLPYWKGAPPLPKKPMQDRFWKQCQHGSWFFLPWHRMYLAYFEQIVAQTIVDLGGPADWALPFWNYSDTANPNALTIPSAFTSPATASNPLWIEGRQSNKIPPAYVTLGALNVLPFTGNGRTGPLGFGGPETSFSHSGSTHGALESRPHDLVHVAIGGAMGDPRTAALDPIFWLHHANIDRLWQVWINQGNRADPIQSSWLDFGFNFLDKTGTAVQMTSGQVENTTQVLTGYTYQGVPSGPRLMKAARTTESFKRADFTKPLDVVAATNKTVKLNSTPTVVPLKLVPAQEEKVNLKSARMATASADAETRTDTEPPKTFLHFENITGKGVPPIHDVYLNMPEKSRKKESYYAGSLAFFGVEEASKASLHHAGSGQHYALDVSELVNSLKGSPDWKEDELDVQLVPVKKMDRGTSLSIGRISLYTE